MNTGKQILEPKKFYKNTRVILQDNYKDAIGFYHGDKHTEMYTLSTTVAIWHIKPKPHITIPA